MLEATYSESRQADMNNDNRLSAFLPIFVLLLSVIGVLAVLSYLGSAGDVKLHPDFEMADLFGLFAALFVVALLVERFIEVSWTITRSEGREHLDTEYYVAKEKNDLDTQERVSKDLITYRSITRKRAMLIGYAAGLLLSLAGIQILRIMFDAGALQGFHDILFQASDVILTASLIAGGSKGIKALTSKIGKFLDSRPFKST